jgi:hypothetical protein
MAISLRLAAISFFGDDVATVEAAGSELRGELILGGSYSDSPMEGKGMVTDENGRNVS